MLLKHEKNGMLEQISAAQLFLLVTVHSNELARIKAIFEMKCDENTEKWWHSFWNITTLLEYVAVARWDIEREFLENLGLLEALKSA